MTVIDDTNEALDFFRNVPLANDTYEHQRMKMIGVLVRATQERIEIHLPAMPESEFIGYMRVFQEEQAREIVRLRSIINGERTQCTSL